VASSSKNFVSVRAHIFEGTKTHVCFTRARILVRTLLTFQPWRNKTALLWENGGHMWPTHMILKNFAALCGQWLPPSIRASHSCDYVENAAAWPASKNFGLSIS